MIYVAGKNQLQRVQFRYMKWRFESYWLLKGSDHHITSDHTFGRGIKIEHYIKGGIEIKKTHYLRYNLIFDEFSQLFIWYHMFQ